MCITRKISDWKQTSHPFKMRESIFSDFFAMLHGQSSTISKQRIEASQIIFNLVIIKKL